MAARLYLIRHAEVVPVVGVEAPGWPLTAEGRSTAERLGTFRAWRELGVVASSPEAKALDTARPIAAAGGIDVEIDPALREVERRRTPIVGAEEYRAMVAAFFASPERSVHGWEPAHEAQARVRSAVDGLLGRTAGTLAVVSHGLALSLLLASFEGRNLVDVEAWAAIPLPAIATVDRETLRLVQPFESADSFLARR